MGRKCNKKNNRWKAEQKKKKKRQYAISKEQEAARNAPQIEWMRHHDQEMSKIQNQKAIKESLGMTNKSTKTVSFWDQEQLRKLNHQAIMGMLEEEYGRLLCSTKEFQDLVDKYLRKHLGIAKKKIWSKQDKEVILVQFWGKANALKDTLDLPALGESIDGLKHDDKSTGVTNEALAPTLAPEEKAAQYAAKMRKKFERAMKDLTATYNPLPAQMLQNPSLVQDFRNEGVPALDTESTSRLQREMRRLGNSDSVVGPVQLGDLRRSPRLIHRSQIVKEAPKLLVLGMSLPSTRHTLAAKQGTTKRSYFSRGYRAALNLLLDNHLNEMDARDMARARQTEFMTGYKVYTCSMQTSGYYDMTRHVCADFNLGEEFLKWLFYSFAENSNGERQLKDPNGSRHKPHPKYLEYAYSRDDIPSSFAPGFQLEFDKVQIDVMWTPNGWDADHWLARLFQETFPGFAKYDMLKVGGDIIMPISFHCFKQVVTAKNILFKFFDVIFVRQQNKETDPLWAGTGAIPSRTLQEIFGKSNDQSTYNCLKRQEIVQGDYKSTEAGKEYLLKVFDQLEDPCQVCGITLKRLDLEREGGGEFRGFQKYVPEITLKRRTGGEPKAEYTKNELEKREKERGKVNYVQRHVKECIVEDVL